MVHRVGRLGPSLLLTFVLTFVGLSYLPGLSSAADPVGKMNVCGQFGFASYGMSQVNAGISRGNAIVERNATAPWKTPDHLHHGLDFMGDANYDLTKTIRIGLNYGRTSGTTKVDFVEVMSVEAKTTTLVPRVFYRLPWRPLENMTFRAFGGLVLLRNARTTITHENTSRSKARLESLTIEGSGTGLTGGITSEYTISDRFTLGFEAGYRKATAKFGSGSYSISKIPNPGLDDNHDGVPNNRELRIDSLLWGFMKTDHYIRGEEPQIRSLDTDFSGVDVRVALHLYIF